MSGDCVERTSCGNPISWMGMLEIAIGMVDAPAGLLTAMGGGAPEPGKQRPLVRGWIVVLTT
jgi:hypothetical protein